MHISVWMPIDMSVSRFDMDVGVSSVDPRLFRFLYGELGPLLPEPPTEPDTDGTAG